MQPAQPPAEEVQELQALLTLARAHLTDAERRKARADQLAGLSASAGMVTRVMQRVRSYEVECWAVEVQALVEAAHRLGIEP
jgi:hypothetical protein